MSLSLIQKLQNPVIYNHPVKYFKILETHISWVILTGDYAYKIKKPFDFEFLNFSTLEKRHFYCQEEIRLNKMFAPEIYIDVVTITGDLENLTINGSAPIIEYAIKMREYPQKNLFTELLKDNQLTATHIDQLAHVIAEFHQRTPVAAADSRFGTAEHVHAPVIQNFDQIKPLLTDAVDLEKLAKLRRWSEKQYTLHQELLNQRKAKGFIRDCHGDLHLGNIVLLNNKPVLFDRIEFNDDLRWTDVLGDIGFLAMDLMDKKQPAYAHRLINKYFSYTGDYQALTLLPYYQVYRAMVRAKIALFSLPPNPDATVLAATLQQYRNFIQLAETYTHQHVPKLMITRGLTGSGKSTIARLVVESFGAIQLSSDTERKRIFNMPLTAQNNAKFLGGIYTPEATEKTYLYLADLACLTLQAGYTTIIDATFLQESQRNYFYTLAQNLNISFRIIDCVAAMSQLEQRIHMRRSVAEDPSEARVDLLHRLKNHEEKLTEHEKKFAVIVNTEKVDSAELIKQLIKLFESNSSKEKIPQTH